MDPMVFSEERHLAYHRVVLSLLDDHPNLLARAVVVFDGSGKVVHTELVPEIAQEPDYDAALGAVGG